MKFDDAGGMAAASISSDLRLASLIQLAPDGIFLTDVSGRYVDVNEAGCQMFKCARADILSKTVFDFLAEEDKPAMRELLERIRETGVHRFEYLLRRPDGSSLPIEVHTKLLPSGERQSILRDISERKEREQTRQCELDAMDRLQAISSLFLSGQSANCILDAILDAAIAFTDADFGNIQSVSASPPSLRILVQRGFSAEWVQFWNDHAVAHGACGVAMAQRSRVLIEDIEESPIFADPAALAVQRQAGVRAVQSTPLLSRAGELMGILSTHYKQARVPPARGLRLLDLLARQAADILEHSRAERQLRRSEARAAGILAIAADALISVDPQSRITEWSHGAERVFGYTRAEAIGAPLDMLLPERYRRTHRAEVNRFSADAGSGRKMDHREAVGLRRSGEEFPIEATISNLQVDGEQILTVALRDISERRRIEREQRLLADIGGALASLDYGDPLQRVAELMTAQLADFALLFASPDDSMPQCVGSSIVDPARAWVLECLRQPLPRPPPDHPIWTVLLEQRPLIGELTPERYETFARHPAQLRAIQAVAPRGFMLLPLRCAGRCSGVLALSSSTKTYQEPDLRLAAEIARRCALFIENARLHRVERQATRAREEVLAVVAHDLRSPLHGVALQTEILLRKIPEPEQGLRGAVSQIQQTAKRMNRIIQDLLDVSRVEAGQLAVHRAFVPARDLLATAIETHREEAASHSLELTLELPGGLPHVSADRDRINQVFDNLIGNALKFTTCGSIKLGAHAAAGEVVFWVADTGEGIPEGQMQHIYDRYWQANRTSRKGAGLGLAIVKGLVEAHGGRVWAESEVGKGSTFYFSLPTAPAVSSAVTSGAAGQPTVRPEPRGHSAPSA